jgi:hypothetical protein
MNAQKLTDSSVKPNTDASNYVPANTILNKSYSKDPNLYVSINNNGIVDGTFYALPLFSIYRIAGKSTIEIKDIKKIDPIKDVNNHTHDERYYKKDEIDALLKIINDKDLSQDKKIASIETITNKLTIDMNNIKAGNNGIGYLKNSNTITSPVTQVEIGIDFKPDLDVLFVFKNTVYLEEGINYEFSTDGKYILPKNDTWTGTVEEPTIFNFLMFKATPMNQLEVDGDIIADGTLNFSKFDAYTQNLIMKIPAERITGGIFGGIVKAKTNTDYTTAQLRNVIMSTTDPDITKMNNGDIWIKYV